MGDPRALPLLRQRWATELYEVHEAVSRVIGNLERKQIGEHDWLQVDTADPYGQLKRIWSQFDVIRGDDLLRARAIQWHSQFVQACMPSSKFGSDEERGNAWSMLGTLIYYFLARDRGTTVGGFPEAAYCFEQCLKYTPHRVDLQRQLSESSPKVHPPSDMV